MYKLNPAFDEEDNEEMKVIQKGVRLLVSLNKLKGFPIARYDMKTKRPYIEHPDGTKEYVNDEI
ncbi:MAG: hypothetical protein FWG91_13915 [Lachnospiraceae bacterium]|nr:hypothetical protein [Lachnospiraceae bacterium]